MEYNSVYALIFILFLVSCSSTPPKNIKQVNPPAITKQISQPDKGSRIQEANKKNTDIFLTKIKSELQPKTLTFEAMVEVSRYIQNQTIVDKREEKYGIYSAAIDEATKLIKAAINKNVIPAVKNYIDSIDSPNDLTSGFVELKSGPFRKLTTYITPEKELQINQIFSTAKEDQLKKIIENEQKHYATDIYTKQEGLNKLKMLNSYELSLGFKFGDFMNDERMKVFNEKRSAHRQNLINKHIIKLTALMGEINNSTDLKTFHDDYLIKPDYYSQAGQLFTQVYSDRLDIISPFVDIRNGRDYITAIYRGDYRVVFQYDIDSYNSYSKNGRYKNMFKNLNIKDKNTRIALREISVFKDVFAQYLLSYEEHYSRCLTKGSFQHKVAHHVPEIITRNGYGVETGRTRGYTKYYKFKVPFKFKEMIQRLGTINKVIRRGFLGGMLNSGGEPVIGITEVMRLYSCGSDKTRQLEDGFIKIYRILYEN